MSPAESANAPAVTAPETASPTGGRPPLFAALVLFLALIAQVPWRKGVLYAGGADPIVLAKAALTGVALLMAVGLALARPRRPIPASPMLFVTGYLAITAIGGISQDQAAPSLILVVRVLMLAGAVTLLMATYPAREVLRAFIGVCALVGFVGALTGAFNGELAGRLGGGLPPLHPNELGAIMALCCIWWAAWIFRGRDTAWTIVGFLVAFGVVVLSGSRTSLGMGLFAITLVALLMTGVRVRNVVALALVPGIAAWVVSATSIVEEAALRGGSAENALTFASRTIAWQAAFAGTEDPWHNWFGGGLAQKTVAVVGQWWDQQVLDSSWVSALVQGGWLGFGLVIIWGLVVLWHALTSERHDRGLWVGLTVFVLGRGLLENGLFDSSVAFLTFFIIAYGVNPGLQPPPRLPRQSLLPSGTGSPSAKAVSTEPTRLW